jgi:hypothetical protein
VYAEKKEEDDKKKTLNGRNSRGGPLSKTVKKNKH